MKKLIYLVVVLAIGGGGYYYWQSKKVPEIPQFSKVAISQGEIVEEVSATGTLQAKKSVGVGSFVSGRVEEVLVDYNDIVRKGQVLARIDTSLLKTQVQIQEANIERQELDLANQRVQLADAKRAFERQRELLEKKLATQQAYEAAELQVKSRESQIASAEKSMVSARFQLDTANTNLGYATITSPVDGVIVDKKVDPGITVQSSQTVATLFTIAEDLTTLKLEGGVDESEIGKVRQGMTVRFGVDAYPNQTFEGQITMVRLNPTIQSNVVTYTTVAEVRNNELKLKPGMTANMRIEVSRRDNVLRVPRAALTFRPNNDMYAALSQEPPTPAGRGAGAGRAGAATPAGTTAPAAGAAAPATPPAAAATPAANPFTSGNRAGGGRAQAGNTQGGDRTQGGRGGDRTGGDRTGGRGGGMNTLTPEQQKQMEAIRALPPDQRAAAMAKAGITFGGGRGGGNNSRGGGRGGGRGGSANATGPATPLAQRSAGSIDELFPAIVRNPIRGQVYILEPPDATHKYGTLKRLDIMTGISNGTFTELVSGPPELTVGTEVVSNIVMPWLAAKAPAPGAQGNPFGGTQPGRGMQGMPGGGGGAPGGGGGGGRGGGGR
jgi:HlyD family secretion protein